MLAADHRPFTTHVVAPFPAGADYTLEGMKCSTLRLPHVVAADLRLCNHHHPLLLQTRLHHPPTPTSYNDTYLRPHHDNLHHISLCTRHPERAPECDARHPDAPTSRSTTSLPISLAQLSGLAGTSQIFILRPLLCTSRTKSPNSATNSALATTGNAPDIISQDRVQKCASTRHSRPTRGGSWDAGGRRARRAC
jgi:hypothetical protein